MSLQIALQFIKYGTGSTFLGVAVLLIGFFAIPVFANAEYYLEAIVDPGNDDIGADYSRLRDRERIATDLEREDRGLVGSLPYDLIGGGPFGAWLTSRQAARQAARVAQGLAPASQGWIRGLGSAAGWGGGASALYGFNQETGDWKQKFLAAGSHGLGGVIAGPVVYSAIRGPIDLYSGIRSLPRRLFGQGQAARDRADDWLALGVDPPGVLTAGPGTQNLAYQQAILDAQRQAAQFAYQEPYTRLQTLGSGIGGLLAGYPQPGFQQTSATQQQVSPLSQALSAAAGAYGLGTLFGK